MSFPKYFLRSHAFLCPTEGYWVLLDVSRNKYLCIRREHFEILGPYICGWQEEPGRRPVPRPPNEAKELASELMAQDILSDTSERTTKTISPIDLAARAVLIEAARRSLWSEYRFTSLTSLFLSFRNADNDLNSKPFEQIIRAVATRKLRYRSGDRPFDFRKAAKLVATFNSLRWFYPRAYVCMFDSLALLQFLARNRLFPNWVFGVTTDPFEAHCWLQEGDVVLNDTIERVTTFTPIMSV